MVEDINFLPEQFWNDSFRFLKLRPKGKEPTGDSVGWQNKNYKWNDTEFMEHVANGGNYGIIGGYGNLILLDADSEKINNICKNLPTTFTVKTGSPQEYKNHYFYIADKKVKPIRFTKEKLGDLGDVRSVGQYVVGANSIHPSGGKYRVVKDIPIARISEEHIRGVFKEFIDPTDNTEFKEYPIETKLRNSRFVRECGVPDYVANNKLEGGHSKNWKLFPYLVDILHNREAKQSVYQAIVRRQGHSDGAIKGWVMKAHEGKLAKTSCKKMRDYLEKSYPEMIEKVCGNCPLYRKVKEIKEIKENKDYTGLQKEVFMALSLKNRDRATELIVDEIKKENYIYSTKDDIKSEMWIYQEGIYVPQGKSYVKEFCRKILGESFTTTLCNLIIAKIEADTFIDHDNFFNTNYIYEIPLINGILDVRTREISDFNPKRIFFNKVPVEFDPSLECESIIEHFKTILKDEEDIQVMMEIFGFLLLKEYRIEKAFMFVGAGRNGKSKTVELMKRFIGAENCSSLPLKALHEESFSLSELFGKMANLAADLSRTDLKETGMIKGLIGRDTTQAKRKFLRDLNFVNYAKMVFAANELPKIYDTTDGFWTKWVLLEFPYKFISQEDYDKLPEEDKKKHRVLNPEIIEELTTPAELSGLLNLALDGLDRLMKKKDFSYSKNTEEVKNIWIRKSDSFTAFCMDHVQEDFDNKLPKKILLKKYFEYRKKHKVPGCSDKAIKITLENNFGVSEGQEYGTSNRYWEGISLR